MTTIELNGNTYEPKMTFKALKEFGIVAGKFEENTKNIGELYTALALGDVYALAKSLSVTTGFDLKKVQQDIEDAGDLDTAFDEMKSFFEETPMTKKLVKTFVPEIKQILESIEQPSVTKN